MSSTPDHSFEALKRRLSERSAHVGVIGLGYVGLPLVLAFVGAGYRVTGFDVDSEKIRKLEAGESYLRHIPFQTVASMIGSGRFHATTDFTGLAEVEVIVICVPTPLSRHREPDLSFVVSTAESIAKHLKPGQVIVLESTTYPGTTSGVVRPILERGGLVSGADFFLGFSPEREDPGNAHHSTTNIPKVVGGDGPKALELVQTLYEQAVDTTVPVSSMDTAEAVKLTENIFRSVNIALVNELKVIYSQMGIDVWEVIEAAKTKPFGFMPFYPGPGLGGHCIPIDPFYLSWKAREFGQPTRFIELAGEINTSMPAYVVRRLARALNDRFQKSLKGSHILLVGISYKKNVDDIRESPAFALIERLEERGAKVSYYDPFVPVIPDTREHAELAGRVSVSWEPETFGDYNAALVCTDHDNVDYDQLVTSSRLVIDTRNATANVRDGDEKVIKA